MNHAKLLHYSSHRGAEITLYEVFNLFSPYREWKIEFSRKNSRDHMTIILTLQTTKRIYK